MLKEEIDADEEGRPQVARMKTGMGRLNDDEQIAALNKFGKDKPQGLAKMYKTIINDYLNETDEEIT